MRRADNYNESWHDQAVSFVPADPPLRPIWTWLNEVLNGLEAKFSAMYEPEVKDGRTSITPERQMRTMLLPRIRSERQRIEQISYNLLYRSFTGLSIEDMAHGVFGHHPHSRARYRFR